MEAWIGMCFFLRRGSRTITLNGNALHFYVYSLPHSPSGELHIFSLLKLPSSSPMLTLSTISDNLTFYFTEDMEVSKRELPRFPLPPHLTCQTLPSSSLLKMSCLGSTNASTPAPLTHPSRWLQQLSLSLSDHQCLLLPCSTPIY